MDARIDDFIARCIFVYRVYTKILHFTLCLLIIPQIINGHRRGLQDTKAEYFLCK